MRHLIFYDVIGFMWLSQDVNLLNMALVFLAIVFRLSIPLVESDSHQQDVSEGAAI